MHVYNYVDELELVAKMLRNCEIWIEGTSFSSLPGPGHKVTNLLSYDLA